MRRRWIVAVMLAASAAAFSAPAAKAQDSNSTDETILTEQQARDLKLTDEQKSQIHSIQQTRREQLRALREDTSLTREQRAERIREINRTANQQIRSNLTPQQQRRFQRRVHDRRQDRRENRRDRGNRRQGQRQRPPRR